MRDPMEILRKITNHKIVKLVNSGDAAIFIALHMAKSQGKTKLIIPDQGGWLTYKTFPKLAGLEVIELRTDLGVVDLDKLELVADKESAFIIPSFAGYFAEQPLEEISRICRDNGCILIEDASGVVGHKRLCNGKYSDIIVASFNKWKLIDLGYGGFVSSNNMNLDRNFLNIFKFDANYNEELNIKLRRAGIRQRFLVDVCKKIKNDLKDYNIIHRDEQGINVVIKYKFDEEKENIINYCEENKYEYTICPRYIRVIENAISIEVKRLRGDNYEKT